MTGIDAIPKLTVTAVIARTLACTYEPSWMASEDHAGAILLPNERLLWGRFREVNETAKTLNLILDNPYQIQVGETYPYVGSYWGERVELVLDNGRTWTRTIFHADAAVRGAGGWIRRLEPTDVGVEVIPGAWDHEHCAICWATISTHEQAEGYYDGKNDWLCVPCFQQYVEPHSLAFVKLNQRRGVGCDPAVPGRHDWADRSRQTGTHARNASPHNKSLELSP